MRDDPKFFIEMLLYIKTKQRGLVKLKFSETQEKIYAGVRRQREEGKPVRIIVLKARQVYCSTLTEALIFQDTVTHPNVNSLVIAHDDKSTSHLFRMSQLYYDMMSKKLRPMIRKSNIYELVFENPNTKLRSVSPGLRSQMRVETSGNPNAARSQTVHNLHISELAMWKKAEETMLGLMQSVPEEPRTMVIIESTAKGIAGNGAYFYEMWMDAVAGNNDFVPIFIPWFELSEYKIPAPKNFELYDHDHPNYGNEAKILKAYNLNFDQMYWRRWYIKNKCKNDLKLFQQEYPANPNEAFLVTGRPVFDSEKIAEYLNRVKSANITPEIGDLNSELMFIPNSMGRLKIWQRPQKDNRYSVGADPAEGLARGDPQSAVVFDRINYEQVADWNGRVSQEEFAHVLKDLARYYNDAMVVPESNNPTTTDYLKAIYYRIYRRKEIGKHHDERTRELGFRTTTRTKPVLIEGFRQLFDDDDLIINDPELLREMSHFVAESNSQEYQKMRAEGRYHDDRVMAAALAIEGLKELYLKVDFKEVKNIKRNPNYKRDAYTGI
jgi:hypothetical protein